VFYLLWRYDPATSALYPPCLFRYLTGLLCPGCGSARALHALLHGDLVAALQLNPMIFVLSAVVAVRVGLRALPRHADATVFVPAISPIAALAVITSFWVLRNIY
jgi:hypothetical protein